MRVGRVTISAAALITTVVGAALTVAASWGAAQADHRDETRLLTNEVAQASVSIQTVIPGAQAPLAGAAQVVAAAGAPSAFQTYMNNYVGNGKAFAGASLWRVTAANTTVVARTGSIGTPKSPTANAGIFAQAVKHLSTVAIDGPLGPTAKSRIAYAVAAKSSAATYVVYAEAALPAARRVFVTPGSAFGDLRFALYLGASPSARTLLITNVDQLPMSGRTVQTIVPLGSSRITVVAASAHHLGGGLMQAMWWIVLAVGAVLSALAVVVVAARRHHAHEPSGRSSDRLVEQATVPGTLQDALLPKVLPHVRGVEAIGRFVPGSQHTDIGGDWYDVVAFDDGTFFFVVGDVSGKGIETGTTVAAVRFAIRALAVERLAPNLILDKLRALPELAGTAQFATVLCGIGDPRTNEVSLVNAGHVAPLVVGPGYAQVVDIDTSPPVGVGAAAFHQPTRIRIEPGSTLVLFTDGLVERRNETMREGLDRVRDTASRVEAGSIAGLVDTLLTRLADGRVDDSVVLAVRWAPG